MLISIHNQFYLIFYSVFAGVLTGMMFDIYRVIRGFENPNKILTFIEDILFWIFASLIVFVFLIHTGYVYVGIYLYIYITFGIYIYIKLFSVWVLKIQYRFIKMICKIIRMLRNTFFYIIELMIHKVIGKNK